MLQESIGDDRWKIFRFVGTGDTTYYYRCKRGGSHDQTQGRICTNSSFAQPIDVQMVITTSHPEHIHCRLITTNPFNHTSQILCRWSLKTSCIYSCLGRIDTLSVPPPHTGPLLLSSVVLLERQNRYHELQFFEEDVEEAMMNDSDTIALHADTYFPGSSEDNPIALAYKSAPDPSPKKLRADAACSTE